MIITIIRHSTLDRILLILLYIVVVRYFWCLVLLIEAGDRAPSRIRVAIKSAEARFLLILILGKFELLRERPEDEVYYSKDDVAQKHG